MKLHVSKKMAVALVVFFICAVNSFGVETVQGFSGAFAPANWESGSNAPAGVNLVDTSGAPKSITIKNYSRWAVSGATFKFPKAPSAGVISFSYKITGGTNDCPASYSVNQKVTILPNNGNLATFSVNQGDSFGFALNGQNLPNDFGCKCNGNSINIVISNFVFTPKAQSMVNTTWTLTATNRDFNTQTITFAENNILNVTFFPSRMTAQGTWSEGTYLVTFQARYLTSSAEEYNLQAVHQDDEGSGTAYIDWSGGTQISPFTMIRKK